MRPTIITIPSHEASEASEICALADYLSETLMDYLEQHRQVTDSMVLVAVQALQRTMGTLAADAEATSHPDVPEWTPPDCESFRQLTPLATALAEHIISTAIRYQKEHFEATDEDVVDALEDAWASYLVRAREGLVQ